MPRAGLDRSRVLMAAAVIADGEGLAAVSFARLAAVLGVRAPSLYNHVESLGALLDGLAVMAAEELFDRARAAIMARSGREALLALAHSHRDYAREHPGLYEAILRSLHRGDAAAAALGDRHMAVYLLVLDSMGHGGEAALHLLRALRAAIGGFVEIERRGGFGLALDIDESFVRMLALLLAGIQAIADRTLAAQVTPIASPE